MASENEIGLGLNACHSTELKPPGESEAWIPVAIIVIRIAAMMEMKSM